jgi:hypothetical protein
MNMRWRDIVHNFKGPNRTISNNTNGTHNSWSRSMKGLGPLNSPSQPQHVILENRGNMLQYMYSFNDRNIGDNMMYIEENIGLHLHIVININIQVYFGITINPYHMYKHPQ